MHFEGKFPEKAGSRDHILDGMSSPYKFVNIVIECLDAQFNAGRAELQHPVDFFLSAPVGSRLDTQAGAAVDSRLVYPPGFLECGGCHTIESIIAVFDERVLVFFRIGQEGSAHDNKLNFVCGVPHFRQDFHPERYLVGAAVIALDCPQYRRRRGCIALRSS